MIWTVKISKIALLLTLALSGLVYLTLIDNSSILFESLESKNQFNEAVFNKVYLQSSSDSDIWLMEQSHYGAHALKEKWDKIAIVVDKKSKTRKAEFFQLMPGNEPISINLKPIGLKASCYLCHSNGPRAIRPNYNSKDIQVSFWNKFRIQLWNLKIKTYGPMESSSPFESSKKFRYDHPMANKELNIPICTKCHNTNSMFGRGKLTKQNFMSIKFMVDNNFMPPLGFSLKNQDREDIHQFVNF